MAQGDRLDPVETADEIRRLKKLPDPREVRGERTRRGADG